MSSYYGIVFPEFWTGPTGRAIREDGGKDGQVLALYLMSCRHATMIGLYRLLQADIRHETGLGEKGMVRGFDVLASLQFADYDLRTEHVWVREMAKFRLGLQKKSPLESSDNRIKAVQNLYDKLPENPFLSPFFDRYAKEVRLQDRRTCSFDAQRPNLSPLTRGSRSPCKPDNRKQESEYRDQVPVKQTGAVAPGCGFPVEKSKPKGGEAA